MFLYGIIMLILCICKVFTGYGENGDGKIPYPFLDVYHQNIFVCIFSGLFWGSRWTLEKSNSEAMQVST